MQAIRNVAAPVGNNPRLERVFGRFSFLRRLAGLEDALLLWEVSMDIFCQPLQGIQNFMRQIRRIGTPQFQESFVEFISEKRAALVGNLANGFRDLREAVVPEGGDSDSDEEQAAEDVFGFLEENYEDLSHVIMVIRWIRDEMDLLELLENGPSKPSEQVGALLNLARSDSRVSARELTNTFPGEAPGDIEEFLGQLIESFDYYSRKSFETTLITTRNCNRNCHFDQFQKEEGEITQCSPTNDELDLQTYLQWHLENQENFCTGCGQTIKIKTFLNKYYVVKIPKPTRAAVTLGMHEEYNLAGGGFRISLLIQEEDGLYTGWIRQQDGSYSYHHKENKTDNCALPDDLTNIVLIIFVRSQ